MEPTPLPIEEKDPIYRLIDMVARQDERMKTIGNTVDRIEKAIYGNGSPGLRATTDNVVERLKKVEEFQTTCPIEHVKDVVEDIQNRHVSEDEAAKLQKKDNLAARDEWRKFRIGLLAAAAAMILDVVSRVFFFK